MEIDKILVFSAHPDDETISMGGSILKHQDKGDEIFWLNITNGNIYQKSCIAKIKDVYKFKDVFNLELPEITLTDIPIYDIISKIEKVVKNTKPNIVYIMNRSDIHSDHRYAFQAIYPCTKNFRAPFIRKILMYETLSETEFSPALSENAFAPNVFVDISDYMGRKLAIMSIYSSEMMPDNLPRSHSAIKALATYRGSRIGVQYAEAFMLLFEKC